MRDVKLALAGTFATGATVAAARSRAAADRGGGRRGGADRCAAVWLLKPAPTPEPKIVTRFNYSLPAAYRSEAPVTSVLDIAPSGELFAFNGSDGIYVRRMSETEARAIPGTTGSAIADIVVSPDGREVAYFRNAPTQLVKIAINGGAPVVLADSVQFPYGLSWEPDGTLYYGQPDGIWRVSHNGGKPEHVVQDRVGPSRLRARSSCPAANGFSSRWRKARRAHSLERRDIVVQSLKSGERRVLRSGGFDARYLPSGYHPLRISEHPVRVALRRRGR